LQIEKVLNTLLNIPVQSFANVLMH